MELFKGLSGKFLIPYALTIVFGIWTYFSVSNILEYQKSKDALLIMQNRVLELRKHEKDFMAREFKNPDFLTTGMSDYLTAFHSGANDLDSLANYLVQNKLFTEQKRDSISGLLSIYTSTFDELTYLIRKKGFKNWGITGALRESIHFVEGDKTPYDRAYMLMLRRHEKDFFLRSDLKYLEKFEAGVLDFKNHINDVVRNPVKRDELLSKIESYQFHFRHVVDISMQIGLNENDGYHGKLRAAVHNLTPYVDQLIGEVTVLLDKKVRQNELALIVLFILIIAVGIIILSWHITKITRNINLIRDNSIKLAEGGFPERMKVNSRDELGQAHNALNILTDGLREKAEFAEKIGKGKLRAEFNTLSDHDILGISLLEMRDNLKAVIDETNKVVNLAGEEGDLEARMEIDNKKGAWKELTESINNLLYSVSTPLITLNRIVNEIARGDVTQRYRNTAKGDIGNLAVNLNSALDNISALLMKIADSAETIERSTQDMFVSSNEMSINTGEIASAVSQISQGAQGQVAKVDHTSVLIEGISRSAREMGDRSETIHQAAKKGAENSQNGTKMIGEVVEAIDGIQQYSSETSDAIEVLIQSSSEISKVVNVITEISTQTNLLALNAAIEAAQAGDAGRGFAVVAEEIRKLADGTRQSTFEIERLIESVKSDTLVASKSIRSMKSLVNSGVSISKDTSSIFAEIAASSDQTLQLSEEILESAKSQSRDIEQIVKNVEGIVVIAEQTAAGTEESAASASELSSGMETYSRKAHSLSEVAHELKSGVSKFKLQREKGGQEELLEEV